MTIIMDFFFNHNSIYIMILFLFLTWKVDFVVKALILLLKFYSLRHLVKNSMAPL